MIHRGVVCVFLLAGFLATALAQPAGDTEKSVQIVRTDTAPVIDGVLDEEVWTRAGSLDDFHEIQPIEYDPAAELTQVFLLHDSENLYIGAKLMDSQPDEIVSQILRQGSNVNDDDYFSVILDPFFDRRNGYLFRLNPNGVREEALYKNTTQTNFDWVGIWQARASVQEDGWVAEMVIPFKTLSFDPENDTWGINFTREIARTRERMGWVSRTRSQNPSVAGTVVGLEGLEQGMGLDVVPSLSATESKDFDVDGNVTDTEPSLDVFYKFTPAMTGVLTLNTDFSATEVDDRQVNLTRFSLFFPEKRDFFLQDADIFEFGALSSRGFGGFGAADQNGRPFFSRKIGLGASRTPVDINAGAKLTGRVGRWNLGVLDIEQDALGDLDATNLFVGRVSANVLEESNVGFIVTDGDPQSNLDNTLMGVDFRYLNTRLPNGRSAEGDVWYQNSDTPGLVGDDEAFGLGLRIRSPDKFSGDFKYVEMGDDFNPALGFANRVGIREVRGNLNYTYRPRGKWYRAIFGGPTFQRSERLLDGSLQSELVRFRVMGFNNNGDRAHFHCQREREGLITPFTIYSAQDPEPEVVIQPGLYEFDSCRINGETGNQRRFSGSLSYETGDFYNGERRSYAPGFIWRPSEHFALDVTYQVDDVVLPEGSFTTRLTRLRSELVFSSTLSWVNLVQWDNDSGVLGINSRLHWIPQAGREVYLVLNHNLEDLHGNREFHSMGADLTAKVNYTFRF